MYVGMQWAIEIHSAAKSHVFHVRRATGDRREVVVVQRRADSSSLGRAQLDAAVGVLDLFAHAATSFFSRCLMRSNRLRSAAASAGSPVAASTSTMSVHASLRSTRRITSAWSSGPSASRAASRRRDTRSRDSCELDALDQLRVLLGREPAAAPAIWIAREPDQRAVRELVAPRAHRRRAAKLRDAAPQILAELGEHVARIRLVAPQRDEVAEDLGAVALDRRVDRVVGPARVERGADPRLEGLACLSLHRHGASIYSPRAGP